jgi:uncharacterized protein (DUF2141 family)
MKKIFVIAFLSAFYQNAFAQKGIFYLNVSNVQPNAGTIRVAIHNRENFLKNIYVTTQVVVPKNSTVNLQFTLEKGEYAVAVSQDFNSNAILDKNLMGVPKEPYAFSNNARPKFRPPTFDEARFYLSEQGVTQNIKLANW